MTGNIELLNYIHQNSEMGQDAINQLIPIVEDDTFKQNLESQFNEYKKIYNKAKTKIQEMDKDAKGINPLSKASSYMMINLKTLLNKSPSHISEMLIQGSTMGTVDITKKLQEYNDADKEILDLGNQLLQFEQRNIEELKRFLH
ncbi:hypothetical protein F8154_04795 [Alkaliphilus pronyensis]|uniref:DUF2383 domain-containing protein n=1 Tax=Alkaliphilus pronyensis TaxID=1482732 RepID=A0A6I0FE64_9FIRM|nr:hypothetical protein [Alkaliphilus pronyensis]KAB3536080.1 hypothetical protein F8154_04795 [Alkaliphilus pronyensis]